MAGLVVGAKVPIIINSRADTAETRYLSLAMAAVLARADLGQAT
jgi:phosphotransacetylase